MGGVLWFLRRGGEQATGLGGLGGRSLLLDGTATLREAGLRTCLRGARVNGCLRLRLYWGSLTSLRSLLATE